MVLDTIPSLPTHGIHPVVLFPGASYTGFSWQDGPLRVFGKGKKLGKVLGCPASLRGPKQRDLLALAGVSMGIVAKTNFLEGG